MCIIVAFDSTDGVGVFIRRRIWIVSGSCELWQDEHNTSEGYREETKSDAAWSMDPGE